MIQANTLYLAAIYADNMAPAKVETLADGTMYCGYCTDDCASDTDKKWMVKRIKTTTDASGNQTQEIYYSNGSRKFNVAWTGHASLVYGPTEKWSSKN